MPKELLVKNLIRYVCSFPAGTKMSAAQLCAQVDGAKLNRQFLNQLRKLREDGLVRLVGIATYEVA